MGACLPTYQQILGAFECCETCREAAVTTCLTWVSDTPADYLELVNAAYNLARLGGEQVKLADELGSACENRCSPFRLLSKEVVLSKLQVMISKKKTKVTRRATRNMSALERKQAFLPWGKLGKLKRKQSKDSSKSVPIKL